MTKVADLHGFAPEREAYIKLKQNKADFNDPRLFGSFIANGGYTFPAYQKIPLCTTTGFSLGSAIADGFQFANFDEICG